MEQINKYNSACRKNVCNELLKDNSEKRFRIVSEARKWVTLL